MYEIVSLKNAERWRQVLCLFLEADVFYTPDYFQSALKLDPGEALLFYFKGQWGEVAYPFIKRKLKDDEDLEFYDITTPFGYGGPLMNNRNDLAELTASFRAAFVDYCRQERIIAEYIRFHPLTGNVAYFSEELDLYPVYETYTLDLGAAMTERKKDATIFVKKLGTVRHLFEFLILYYSTIRRREKTHSFYFFTNDYFETLVSAFGPDLHLFGAYKGEKLMAASYVLASDRKLFLLVEGSLGKEGEPAMEQLLLTISDWAIENDFDNFHIGGDDQLDELQESFFKKNLSPESAREFYIGRKIFDHPTFRRLVPESESEMIRRYRNN